ncbi:hypothetical protein J1N35_004782 [Gossypium stocksii]|uniref:ABC1 atypical kinase-like domain-containing protein n=1 Tax=Gossypium stocksii TaxID=47602 RepID=A0A9D4AGF2_9ROSI|nr:hypothetical protein J1N35_004782 [Gossypium stocksii]
MVDFFFICVGGILVLIQQLVCVGELTSRIAGLFLRILWWNALSSLMISIFKVHQAGLRGDRIDDVVKVQHPGIQDLMMIDIRNLQAFALFIQENDIKFDLISVTKEMEKQVSVFTLMFLAKHIYHSFMYFSDYVNCEYRFTWIWISFFFCMSLIIYPLCCQDRT